MTRTSSCLTLILLAAAIGATPARAETLADLGGIDRAVSEFLGASPGQAGGAAFPVDRRLRLAACPAHYALGWMGTRRDTVEIACPVSGGWKLYVPLTAPGSIGAAAPAPAAAPVSVVSRGDAVTVSVIGDGFAVAQNGEALESGAVGSWIKVRTSNPASPVLRGKVSGAGRVDLELP